MSCREGRWGGGGRGGRGWNKNQNEKRKNPFPCFLFGSEGRQQMGSQHSVVLTGSAAPCCIPSTCSQPGRVRSSSPPQGLGEQAAASAKQVVTDASFLLGGPGCMCHPPPCGETIPLSLSSQDCPLSPRKGGPVSGSDTWHGGHELDSSLRSIRHEGIHGMGPVLMRFCSLFQIFISAPKDQ